MLKGRERHDCFPFGRRNVLDLGVCREDTSRRK